jgi:cytochrome c oxidase subunit 4
MSAEKVEGTPKLYWTIALILAVVTAVEIAVPQVEAVEAITVPLLLLLGAFKFLVVVWFFMHLKWDNPRYRGLFFLGVIGAIILFGVVLLTFRAF